MKIDHVITKKDVDDEIEKNGYAIIRAQPNAPRYYYFVLKNPREPDRYDYRYYYASPNSTASEVFKESINIASYTNFDVTWLQVISSYRDMVLVHLTLFDLVET